MRARCGLQRRVGPQVSLVPPDLYV